MVWQEQTGSPDGMTRPAVRIVLFLLLLGGVGAAAWQLYVLEQRRLDGLRQQQRLDGAPKGAARLPGSSQSARHW